MNKLRSQRIDRARNDVQDCLIIGAGINGAVAAAALTGSGGRITIIDRGDFASQTSQESSNLAWGGIKYLENYEFALVRGLCKSRNHLMESYPSQVKEIRFYTSIAKGFRKPRLLIYAGTLLYWFMGGCRTRPPRLLSRARIAREAPEVNTDGLTGGLEYSDGYFTENDARFAFTFIRKALRNGCNAVNYAELQAAEQINGLWHSTILDGEAGTVFTVKSRTLINAAGPFADRINSLLHIQSRFRHIFSKGAHIIVPRITREERVLTFFASDGRLFFMIPMGNRTCIGTTDTRVDGEHAPITGDDVQFLLSNANALLDLEQPLTEKDVLARRCGVRPLVVKNDAAVEQAEWTALSRKHEMDIHPEARMCSIYGGKLTDCINVGEEVIHIIRSFGIHMFKPLENWYGEASTEKRRHFIEAAEGLSLKPEQAEQLWRRYGKEAFQCLDIIRKDAKMKEKVIGQILRAELHLMAEREMVLHLEDFLRRRTRLALTEHAARLRCDPGLTEAATILFGKAAKEKINAYFGIAPPPPKHGQQELKLL